LLSEAGDDLVISNTSETPTKQAKKKQNKTKQKQVHRKWRANEVLNPDTMEKRKDEQQPGNLATAPTTARGVPTTKEAEQKKRTKGNKTMRTKEENAMHEKDKRERAKNKKSQEQNEDITMNLRVCVCRS
jgi:hypothetical protein